MHRYLLGFAAFALLVSGCGTDEPDPPTTTLRPCADLVGQPTMDVVTNACADETGGTQVNMTFSLDCPDGNTLYWNDTGWGWSNGAWQNHTRPDGQLVPPDQDMARCQP